MKRLVLIFLLIIFVIGVVSCDNSQETTESQSESFVGPTSYTATLVCPEDESINGKKIEVLWKQTYDFPTPKRENYRFNGWICGDDKLNSLDIWPYAHDAELVASWTPITYKIEYKLSPMLSDAFTNYNTETKSFFLPVPKLINDYMFVGWTGEGVTEPSKELFIQTGSSGNKKYTANWLSINDVEYKDENGFAFKIIEDYAVIIGYYGEPKATLYIPSEYNGYPVKRIASNALNKLNDQIRSSIEIEREDGRVEIYIPSTLTEFEDYALGDNWAIAIDGGNANEWFANSTFGKGNGALSPQND